MYFKLLSQHFQKAKKNRTSTNKNHFPPKTLSDFRKSAEMKTAVAGLILFTNVL